MSTLYTDNIRANNASQITVPTGQKIVGTDSGSIVAPGHVVQVVNATYGTGVTLASPGAAVETGLTATITPKFSTSKILILANQNIQVSGASYAQVVLRKGTIASNTILAIMSSPEGYTNSTDQSVNTIPMCYEDSPATTSATRYFCSMELLVGGAAYAQTSSSGTSVSTITLMEIAQ